MANRRIKPGFPFWLVRAAAAIIVIGATGMLVAMVTWPVIAEVSTGQTPEYPDIRPLDLRYSPELVLERAVETIAGLDGWTLVTVDREDLSIQAMVRLAVLGWTYEVSVRILPMGSGSRIHVRSRSTSGRGDFGQNARNIRRLQDTLTANLDLARRAE